MITLLEWYKQDDVGANNPQGEQTSHDFPPDLTAIIREVNFQMLHGLTSSALELVWVVS